MFSILDPESRSMMTATEVFLYVVMPQKVKWNEKKQLNLTMLLELKLHARQTTKRELSNYFE